MFHPINPTLYKCPSFVQQKIFTQPIQANLPRLHGRGQDEIERSDTRTCRDQLSGAAAGQPEAP